MRTRPPEDAPPLELLRRVRGRMVLAEGEGTLHLGHNYAIYRSDDDGASWRRVGALPRSPWRRAAELSRLACRLVRQEVRALARTPSGGYVAANREGVFHGVEGAPVFAPSRVEAGDVPLMPPMRITVGLDGCVLWGEYGSSRRPRPVRLFASHDGGASFRPVLRLPPGSVGHVHNVVPDAGRGHYWVLAGDHGDEPGIGILSGDLQRFEWLVKGEQRFRVVGVFDLGDRLLYATDTEVERNGLIVLEKDSGRAERIRDFEGSCIYSCRYGGLYALSTSVEPSAVNDSPFVRLWLSRDGERWWEAWRARKDRWNADYFQFGSIVLPSGATEKETVLFSGQAVKDLDGWTAVARLRETAKP